MKTLLLHLVSIFWICAASAHDHIEAGLDPTQPGRLTVEGEFDQIATFFPVGEAPSLALAAFPGGAFANELTFSAFDNTAPPGNAFVRAEILMVEGPAGGSLSFWNTGETNAAWTRPAGWSASQLDAPGIPISEPGGGGYGHLHGRAFSMDRPGEYKVTFRVVDMFENYANSLPFVIRFTALPAPPMSILWQNNSVRLSFVGREGLNYDVQSTSTLRPDDWVTIGDPLEGEGEVLEFVDPVSGRDRVFYRLVEYQ